MISMAQQRSPRRVLFLFTQVAGNGGIQRFNRTILDACSRLGVDCRVLALNDPRLPIEQRSKCGDASIVGFSGGRRRFALAVAGELMSGRHDQVMIGHINLLALAIGLSILRPFRRIPTLLIAHGVEVWRGIRGVRRYALAHADRILCVSHYTRQRILEQAPALMPERLLIFPNALADSWGRAAPASGAPTPAARKIPGRFILSVTRLERGDRYKGIATVIEAFSMIADDSLEYYVIGQGDDIPFLELIADRCGVGRRVHFVRGVSDAELLSLYERCEAFVLPSGNEGFGIVFLEAMYFGAPVIAAREKGAIDVVRDGETGIAVPFGDTVAIKEAIERIRSDAVLRTRLCANGRSMVVDGGPFTFGRFTERCADVLGLRRAIAA
jgi:glycosyltransferase involved in cell wall biosynthesis